MDAHRCGIEVFERLGVEYARDEAGWNPEAWRTLLRHRARNLRAEDVGRLGRKENFA